MLRFKSFIHYLSCWKSKSFPKLLSYYQEGVKSFFIFTVCDKMHLSDFFILPLKKKEEKNLLANVTGERWAE